jgi:rare lipoprotein A
MGLFACSDAPVQRAPDSPGYGQRPPPMQTSQLLRRPGGFYTDDGPDGPVPANLETALDAVPRAEALHPSANEPYAVFGQDYVPLRTAAGYRRQGTASWYGRKFHGQRTVSGEIYDMFAMTAAHPTLPIPSYARVTNLENNRSAVVRINDRGPFGSGRIMDVSYAAAARLGFTESALAPVDVEGIATGPAPPTIPVAAPTITATAPPEAGTAIPAARDRRGIFLQLGAFGSRANAENFRERLRRQLDWIKTELDIELRANLHRVQLGPYRSRAEADAVSEKIRAAVEIKPLVVVR